VGIDELGGGGGPRKGLLVKKNPKGVGTKSRKPQGGVAGSRKKEQNGRVARPKKGRRLGSRKRTQKIKSLNCVEGRESPKGGEVVGNQKGKVPKLRLALKVRFKQPKKGLIRWEKKKNDAPEKKKP